MGPTPLETRVQGLCRKLKLPAVARDAARLSSEVSRQGAESLAHLTELLDTELKERQLRREARRIKEASFPVIKTLEGSDFRRVPRGPRADMHRARLGAALHKASEPRRARRNSLVGMDHLGGYFK